MCPNNQQFVDEDGSINNEESVYMEEINEHSFRETLIGGDDNTVESQMRDMSSGDRAWVENRIDADTAYKQEGPPNSLSDFGRDLSSRFDGSHGTLGRDSSLLLGSPD